ncbi:hypothetical protein VNO77_43233 [Canavalia gladiata]|uniref:Uncharacterized protein n=1 Tax=Canavalia gladiata TaxID=3824 RepID=A0AAN9PPV5_CANGL
MPCKTYTTVMGLVLASIAIKNEGSHTNPFQHSTPTILIFFTATFCHALVAMADMTNQTSIIIFHVSGLIACETLLWILLAEFWCYYFIINLFLLLVASFCFSNFIAVIVQFLRASARSNLEQLQNMEPQEAQI